MGTLTWNVAWERLLGTLRETVAYRKRYLGTLLRNTAWEHCLPNTTWEHRLRTLPWNAAFEHCVRTLPGTRRENVAWKRCLGTLPGNSAWERCVHTAGYTADALNYNFPRKLCIIAAHIHVALGANTLQPEFHPKLLT